MMLKLNKFFYSILFLLFLFPSGLRAAENLSIDFHPYSFTAPAELIISTLPDAVGLPWEWQPLSSAYEYSFRTKGFYDPSRPLELKISYNEDNNYLKQIFSYDSMAKIWRPLLTHDFPAEKYVTAQTKSTSGRVIVLYSKDVLTVGTASWYKFKNGLFAASPDFLKGTVVRVHNLDNGKFVDVTINDWGPERDKHPDRVIDLDYVAFGKIASPSAGLIPVKVEALKTVIPALKKETPQLADSPNLTASAAIIISEKDGRVLWGKNESSVLPIASLTKMVATRVFLDTKPDLNKVVAYKYQDEKYNYEYCKPWESSRLRVSEGETMTVEDLLYSTLVGSANNAIETLVRVSGLSRAQFVSKMNETVKSWGALNTKFVEPSGLSPNNVSSPFDYAIITKEVFSNPLMEKISTTARYTFKTINTQKSHTLTNTNQLLRSNKYPIVGSKTGYLDEAGYCLMTRTKTSTGNIISINLNSQSKDANFLDNENLIRYGLRLMQNK
ncbi:MAG: RlpA-like double-psi beta-barrel domain-containing protein [Patescibacteria group bacterium]